MTLPEAKTKSAGADATPEFHRVLLKVSGEALMGEREYGMDLPTIDALAAEIVGVHSDGVEIAIVVGGGNIYRGMAAAAEGMDRATADYAGMLATLLNALALQDALERAGANTRVQSAIEVAQVAEQYIRSARSATSRRAGSCSSRQAPATRTSRPTPRLCCARSRSARRRSS